MIDTIRGLITYGTAAVVTVGGMILAYISWASSVPEGGGRDLTVLFTFLALIVGGAVQFLFNAESAKQATKSAERAAANTAANQPTVTTGGQPPVTPSPAFVEDDDGA